MRPDGAVKTTAPAPSPAPVSLQATTPATESPAFTTAKADTLVEKPRELKRWRVIGSGLLDAPLNSHGKGGALLSASFFLAKQIGINTFGGIVPLLHHEVFGGGEIEIVPLRLSLGRFDELIEVGVLAGASTLARKGLNWVSPHAGARFNVNVGDLWSITASVRGNKQFGMADAGIAIRL
ncbi:hypothetical protein WDW37_21345 [Bdellovibrionota bacterium FG-1]